ncbi:hypothetical protein ElyMa_003833000 [Elysia marginata]|uniref:Uncharacterized protein n=1 Tax=Elysia marginata TaxID=1093978 RepID=A0AAV4FIK1_9GAST|nr:hypothetical protein ElyMa_003833000 [Elysia marginata]
MSRIESRHPRHTTCLVSSPDTLDTHNMSRIQSRHPRHTQHISYPVQTPQAHTTCLVSSPDTLGTHNMSRIQFRHLGTHDRSRFQSRHSRQTHNVSYPVQTLWAHTTCLVYSRDVTLFIQQYVACLHQCIFLDFSIVKLAGNLLTLLDKHD